MKSVKGSFDYNPNKNINPAKSKRSRKKADPISEVNGFTKEQLEQCQFRGERNGKIFGT